MAAINIMARHTPGTNNGSVKVKTVHIILPYQYRIKDWIQKHAAGLVPGQMQYDLLRLSKYGLSVSYHESTLFFGRKPLSRYHNRYGILDGLHILQQIRPALRADCVFTRLDPEGLMVCLLRKMKLFGLHRRPHIFKVSWLPAYLETASGARRRCLISLLKSVDLFEVGGPRIQKYIQRHCAIPDERFSNHAHGVDIDFFKPSQVQADDFILCAGNDRYRDFEILNRISDGMRGRTKLIVASELHEYAGRILETDRLMFMRLSHADLRDYYNRAKFVIIPIRRGCVTDSGITAMKEAMAMGKAVIASATLFMQEIVHDGINGLLVEPGNPEAFIDRINCLLDNPGICNQLGTEAGKRREAFSTDFQLKGLAADMLSILRNGRI